MDQSAPQECRFVARLKIKQIKIKQIKIKQIKIKQTNRAGFKTWLPAP